MSFFPEIIYIAGHTGLVEQAFLRKLQSVGNSTLLLRTHMELDLTSQVAVSEFFSAKEPDCVFFCVKSWRNPRKFDLSGRVHL